MTLVASILTWKLLLITNVKKSLPFKPVQNFSTRLQCVQVQLIAKAVRQRDVNISRPCWSLFFDISWVNHGLFHFSSSFFTLPLLESTMLYGTLVCVSD